MCAGTHMNHGLEHELEEESPTRFQTAEGRFQNIQFPVLNKKACNWKYTNTANHIRNRVRNVMFVFKLNDFSSAIAYPRSTPGLKD